MTIHTSSLNNLSKINYLLLYYKTTSNIFIIVYIIYQNNLKISKVVI